jgi:hypothetical protein
MDRQRLEQALIAADAAGDADAARELASALRGLRSSPTADKSEYDSSSPEWQAKYGPTSGMSALQRTAAGAGKFLSDLKLGVPQALIDGFGNSPMGQVAESQLPGATGAISQYLQRRADEKKVGDAPLMETTAGKVGNIGGGVAFSAPLAMIPGANTYAGSAVLGAGLGAAQPVGSDDSRALNMGMGAAGGVAGKFAGDRISTLAGALRRQLQPAASRAAANVSVGPSASAAQATASGNLNVAANGGGAGFGTVGDDAAAGLNAAQRQAAEAGRRIGMRQTPGQATGSRALQQMEAKLESQPMTSGPFNRIKANNARVISREFLRAIGETGDEVTPQVISRADTRIGGAFEEAAQNNHIAWDDALQADLAGVVQTASNELQEQEARVIARQAEDLLAKAARNGGVIDGQAFQNSRQALTRLSIGSNSSIGYWARQLRESLDDALIRSVGPADAGRLATARGQYRILATAMNRTGALNTAKGTVQPGILANALAQSDRAGYTMGRNNSGLYDALRFAQAFQPIVGDSGTATRSMLTNPLEIAASLPFNLATRAYTSSPAVNAAVGAQAAGQNLGSVTEPFLRGTAPYLPVVGGLLGVNAAR